MCEEGCALKKTMEDIPLLVKHFASNICSEYGITTKEFSGTAIKELQKLRWTGNIRELRNVVERLIILGGSTISKNDVCSYVNIQSQQPPKMENLLENIEDVEALKRKLDTFLSDYKTTLS